MPSPTSLADNLQRCINFSYFYRIKKKKKSLLCCNSYIRVHEPHFSFGVHGPKYPCMSYSSLKGLTFKTTCKPPSFTVLMWNPSFSFFFLIVFYFSSLFCSFHPSLSPATIILFDVVTWTIFFIYNTYRANISDRYVFNLLSLRYYAITSLDSIGFITTLEFI